MRDAKSHERLVHRLQADLFADDLHPPADSIAWTAEELQAWFEHGGICSSRKNAAAPLSLKSLEPRLAPYQPHPIGTTSRYRVTSIVPAPVFASSDALQGQRLCEFEHGTIVEVVEELLSASGRAMVRVVDPVWNGWMVRRVASCDAALEPVKEPTPECTDRARPALDAAASASLDPPDSFATLTECGSKSPTGSAMDAGTQQMSPRQLCERDDGKWEAGIMVLLSGLHAQREYNGRSGVVERWIEETGRYSVQLANRTVRVRPTSLSIHPLQLRRERQSAADALVFLSVDEAAAREGTYAVRLDPQYWYDQALERVFNAANEFEVLDLPFELTDDLMLIRRQYRKVSLAVHPDKNRHPQADAAFRKVYGAFETLSDLQQQRRVLLTAGFDVSEAERARYAHADDIGDDDDDSSFEWWWQASVPQVEKAAEEAEGAQLDSFAAAYVSDGLGGAVEDVRWIGVKKAMRLHRMESAIFIDCREDADHAAGGIGGAWHVPMGKVHRYGIVSALGPELIHDILSRKRNSLIIVYSNVATPFSRCRAFCRWLLRAGHRTLPAERFRRMRGGIFGWMHLGQPIVKSVAGRYGGTNHEGQDAGPAMEATIDLD